MIMLFFKPGRPRHKYKEPLSPPFFVVSSPASHFFDIYVDRCYLCFYSSFYLLIFISLYLCISFSSFIHLSLLSYFFPHLRTTSFSIVMFTDALFAFIHLYICFHSSLFASLYFSLLLHISLRFYISFFTDAPFTITHRCLYLYFSCSSFRSEYPHRMHKE